MNELGNPIEATAAGPRAVPRLDDPAPSYELERYGDRDALIDDASWFARLVDRQLPPTGTLADIGCGTGRFSCFMALRGRRVTGVDYTEDSLRRARALRDRLRIDGVDFVRGDIRRLPLDDASFDVTLSHGVLQNLDDPESGFRQMVRVTRPGGHVVVGIYNRFGRLPFQLVRRVLGGEGRVRSRLRRACVVSAFDLHEASEESIQAYVQDQFDEPREKSFTVGDLLCWFERTGVDWVGSYPPIGWRRRWRPLRLFGDLGRTPPSPPGRTSRALAQLGWALDVRDLGGLFIMAGRRRTSDGGSA